MAADGFWNAWPNEPVSLFASESLITQMGQRGKVSSFVNAQGLRLTSYFWPAAQPRAVIQLNHGNGAYVMEFLRTQVLTSGCHVCVHSMDVFLPSHQPRCSLLSTRRHPMSNTGRRQTSRLQGLLD